MVNSNLPPLDPRQRYTVAEACLYLRQSRAQTYRQIRDGKLRVLKDGARTYVPGVVIAERSRLEPVAA